MQVAEQVLFVLRTQETVQSRLVRTAISSNGNAALRFTREEAYGMRLNLPAGTAVRFETGDNP